jgi:hypothetical protein
VTRRGSWPAGPDQEPARPLRIVSVVSTQVRAKVPRSSLMGPRSFEKRAETGPTKRPVATPGRLLRAVNPPAVWRFATRQRAATRRTGQAAVTAAWR